MSTTDVDTICLDSDLEDAIVGPEQLAALLPDGWSSAKKARQLVLDRVLKELLRQTPPIKESDLADPTELKDAVIFGTLTELYFGARVDGDDRFTEGYKRFAAMYKAEVSSLRPTISGGYTGGPTTITLNRR